MTDRSYVITPRPAALGGGWNLKLFEQDLEMGGGVFPRVNNTDTDIDEAYDDALGEGQMWVRNEQV